WWLSAAEYDAFKAFPAEAILPEIERRAATGNRQILIVMLQLSANVLGHAAAPWVRDQYPRARRDGVLFSWAESAASCLPEPEGLPMTIDALREYSGHKLRQRMSALSWFRSPDVLDWIEIHAPRTNVTDDWGRLAALSGLSLARVKAWLAGG